MIDPERDRQVERLLSEANRRRARGEPEKAEAESAKAVELDPRNGAARELHGDMLQLLGEIEKALEEYREVLTISPGRASAERKFAQVTLAIASEQARTAVDENDPEAIVRREAEQSRKKKNPIQALLYSLVIPGAGQFYNGEREKGVIIAGVWIFASLFFLVPAVAAALQLYATLTDAELPGNAPEPGFWGPVGFFVLMGITAYSALEAYLVAKTRLQ